MTLACQLTSCAEQKISHLTEPSTSPTHFQHIPCIKIAFRAEILAQIMATPLQWLGGAEEDVMALQALAGHWHGRDGSLYHLFYSQGKVDVLTCRPNGTVRFTKGLVQAREKSIVWGTMPQGFFLTFEQGGLTWTRGRQRFVWSRFRY